VRADITQMALRKMKLNEYGFYLQAANETGNTKLKEGVWSLILANFLRFRRTEGFKIMSLEDLKEYLIHEYLEFEFEKEVFIKRN